MPLLSRMIRAMKLDSTLFEEVEHDRTATPQAIIVVVLASLLPGVGVLLGQGGMASMVGTVVSALVGWLLWSVVTYFVGTKLFGGTADIGEMMRALGFAYTPLCLGLIPVVGWIVGTVWAILAFVVATRQALDFGTGKAIGTVILGAVGMVSIMVVKSCVF